MSFDRPFVQCCGVTIRPLLDVHQAVYAVRTGVACAALGVLEHSPQNVVRDAAVVGVVFAAEDVDADCVVSLRES